MKRTLISALLCICHAFAFSQSSPSVFVQNSGSGETTYAPSSGFSYSHHTNYTMQIRSITAKWSLSTLMGEPVVDGVFKWEAGQGTPADYLDYRDCVLLECSPNKSTGYMVYIRLWPTVPKAGAGYGFNTPGSPSWENLFCTRSGKSMTTEIPDFTARTAYEIWKNRFYVTGVVLNRIGGNDGYLQADTRDDGSRQEEYDRQKALQEQRQAKVKALDNPFTLSVKDKDTVYRDKIRLFSRTDPFFSNANFLVNAVNVSANTAATTGSPDEDIQLYEGWNNLHYSIFSAGFTLRGRLEVFYKKNSPGGILLSDDFNHETLDDRWITSGYSSPWVGTTLTDGHLLIRQGGDRTHTRILTKELHADTGKELILEFKSTFRKSDACYEAWILINRHTIICRKQCDVAEAVKLVWDLRQGTIRCYIDGELYSTGEGDHFKSADGIVQFGWDCDYFKKWEIDDVKIYQ